MVNPYTDETSSSTNTSTESGFGSGVVVSVTDTTRQNHGVIVREERYESAISCRVATRLHGDANLPEEGQSVLLEYREEGRPTVIGYTYENEAPPEFEEGERVIGHPASDAQIRLKSDGSIHIQPDGENVVINDGDQGAIYDVTTSKSNGNVTSITLHRRDNILI